MLLLPEIQIAGGTVVTRVCPEAPNVVHGIEPMTAVRDFEAQGAERIVLLDVDAALCKQATHAELIESLINATQIPVMAAGGLRTLAQIEGWFERGAGGAGHRGAHRSSFVGPGLRPPPSGHRRQPRH